MRNEKKFSKGNQNTLFYNGFNVDLEDVKSLTKKIFTMAEELMLLELGETELSLFRLEDRKRFVEIQNKYFKTDFIGSDLSILNNDALQHPVIKKELKRYTRLFDYFTDNNSKLIKEAYRLYLYNLMDSEHIISHFYPEYFTGFNGKKFSLNANMKKLYGIIKIDMFRDIYSKGELIDLVNEEIEYLNKFNTSSHYSEVRKIYIAKLKEEIKSLSKPS